MSEVRRYGAEMKKSGTSPMYASVSGQWVHWDTYSALAAQRDEGLAREADLREALRIAETYVQTAFARAQQKDKLGRKLPADHPISADLSRVLAALASPACADGKKAPISAINLPRRKVKTEYSTAEEDAQVDAWNAALDAVQELNK